MADNRVDCNNIAVDYKCNCNRHDGVYVCVFLDDGDSVSVRSRRENDNDNACD